MIDLAILGMLEGHELHGYELRKHLGELLGSRLAVSFGSIYPALAKLERKGWVKAVSHGTITPPPAPMSGSLTGELAAYRASSTPGAEPRRGSRGKKVYGITDRGRERLHELLVGPDGSDREFAVKVAFCQHLTPDERLALFERRRSQVRERGQALTPPPSPGRGPTPGPSEPSNPYLQSLLEHDREAAAFEEAWLGRLIDAERAALAGAAEEPRGEPES